MTFIADLFAKLRTPKNVVRYMSKKSRFIGLTAPLPYLVIILKVIESEKVCFNQMQSLISVC